MVRLGFIGAGGIAQHHRRLLGDIPEATVAAVCDVDPERAKTFAEAAGATVFPDAEALIGSAEIDALFVCVPPNAHGEIEIQAAGRGLHLFVEKPVNLYMDRARAVAAAICDAGVLSQVGYGLRYSPLYLQLKETLADKEVGTAHVFRWGGLPGSPWWRRYDQSGGQLVEMTTHQIDLLRWVLGEVESVSAVYSQNRLHASLPGVTVPDSQAILLHFASGAVGTVNTSCAIGNAWMGGVEFAVRDARVSVEGNAIKLYPEDAFALPPPVESPNVDQAFIKAVTTGDPSLLKSPYDDGLKTLAVTLAANASAAAGGRPIRPADLEG